MGKIEEIWKEIPGYEGLYQASNLGRIKSVGRLDFGGSKRKERILRPGVLSTGYCNQRLYKEGISKYHYVHRLVYDAFIGAPPPRTGTEINHIDGNKANNRIENLELCTYKENQVHWRSKLSAKRRGVFKNNKCVNRPWASIIKIEGKCRYLGWFSDKEEAYKAFYFEYMRVNGVEPWDPSLNNW